MSEDSDPFDKLDGGDDRGDNPADALEEPSTNEDGTGDAANEEADETSADDQSVRERLTAVVEQLESQTSFKEKFSSRWPERPSMEGTGNIVVTAVDKFTSALAGLLVMTLISVSKILPFTERFFRGLLNAGYRGLYGTTSSDAIGHILVGNELKFVPVSYDHEKGRYENRYGDYWNVASEGDYEYRVAGRVPALWASAASNELGSHVQAEAAEVLDMGKSQPMVNADVNVVLEADQATGAGQAVADGGYQLELDNVSEWVDEVVDLRHDAAARVLSMEKYYETYPSVVAPEEMKMQEERGRLAEEDRDYAKLALYMMLVAAGIIAIVELGPIALKMLFGGGGGGGGGDGSFIPMMLGLVGGLRR